MVNGSTEGHRNTLKMAEMTEKGTQKLTRLAEAGREGLQ
jgi:hypothetical protein